MRVLWIFGLICSGLEVIYGLSMQEAIDKALEYSARIQMQKSYVSSATYYRYSTFSPFSPLINSGYSYSYNSPSVSRDYSLNSFNITGNINIFRGFQDYFTTKESSQNLTRQNLNLKTAVADIRLATKLAYIKVLQAKALLQTAQESSDLLEKQFQKATSFYQQGLRAKNEVLTMQLQYASSKITLENAKMNLTYALNELGNLTGLQIDSTQVQEIEKVDIYEYDKKDLLHKALQNNPDYLYLKSQLESAKIAFKTTKGTFLPQIDLIGTKYWYVDGASAANAYYGLQSQIRLNITWNIFNGLKDGFTYQTKKYDILAFSSNLTQYERNIELSLDSWLRDYENAKSQLVISEESLQQARENYTIINNRYLQNLSTYTELINAQLLLTTMQTNINQARYNIISIQSNIQRLTNP